MQFSSSPLLVLSVSVVLSSFAPSRATAERLIVKLGNAEGATLVGAIQRWDADGNPRRQPDPKAKIDAPAVDAAAEAGKNDAQGRAVWVFQNLPEGKYDVVIVARGRRLRVEGFQFAPVKEFDPFISADAKPDDAREFIVADIKKSPHYENKVEPFYLAGDDKAIRALVMLLRDKPTSFEGESPGAATLRHEIWQYSWNYGGWQKEKRTRVMDRVLMHRDELRRWTWLWDAKLGGVEVKGRPVEVRFELPRAPDERKLKGLYPY